MVTTLIIGSSLLILAFILCKNFNDILHPAVAYPATWGCVLNIVAFAQQLGYYQVQLLPLLLYFCGAGAFIIGAMIVKPSVNCAERNENAFKTNAIDIRRLALFCSLAHMIIVPLWWNEIIEMTNGKTDVISLSFALRYLTASGGEKLSALVGNYLVAGFVIVPILIKGAMELNARWSIVVVVSAPWFVTNIVTNGRASLVQLLLAIFYLYVLQNRVIKLNSILIIGALITAVLTTGVVLVGKNDAAIEGGLGELLSPIVENTLDYVLQGPILFSKYFENENLINPTWDALVFPCSLLQHLNVCTVGSQHQDFLPFHSDGRVGNVYSIFFSIYPKYGIVGLMLFLAGYGAWAGFHHHRARTTQSLTHSLMAAYLYAAIVLSVFSDYFAPSLNFFIKMIILSFVIQLAFQRRLSSYKKPVPPKSRSTVTLGSAGG